MAKILLIDDEIDVRDSIKKVLSVAGHEVVTAENAEVGLTILEKESFDVLITDIIMPGMDGVQVIQHVRKLNPGIKIVAISGGGNFGVKDYQPGAITTTAYLQAAADAGADSVLTKPFDRADLVETVESVLSQS